MKFSRLALLSTVILPLAAFAAGTPATSTPTSQTITSVPATGAMSDGLVKKVDSGQGKITLGHGPLENLGMPAMTMVFHVADPTMTTKVKVGDKVKFRAVKATAGLTIERIETAH